MTQPLDEEAVIAAAQRYLSGIGGPLLCGIGDDAAVVSPPGERLLLTTDLLIEGVHFERAWTSAADLGWKSLAVNLSDIAAMGGSPYYALLSLGLPGELDMVWVEDFLRGLGDLAERHGVAVAGGDTVASPGVIAVNLALVGSAEVPICRNQSRAGDVLFVTGTVGAGAAGLWACRHLPEEERDAFREVVQRLLRPEPHLAAGWALRPWADCISLLDDSDGVVRSVEILARANGTGAVIDMDRLPISPAGHVVAHLAGEDPLRWALYGGDDYQLIGAAPPSQIEVVVSAFRQAALPFTVIGKLTDQPGVWLRDSAGGVSPADPSGPYRHFPGK